MKTWYKGKAVKSFKANKTYVVEFWATWCGPCRESIPHLTEMAKKNKDVTFVGVSIWEDDKGGNIKKFVSDMGAKMDYNVGYSGNKTGMSKTWMEAAGQNGIPTAFVVKNKKVLWIAHPMEMEKPLAEIKSGKFNLAKFKTEFSKQAAVAKAEMASRAEVSAVDKMIKEGKYAEASAKLDALEKKTPSLKPMLANQRFVLLSKQDPTAWEARVKELSASTKQEDKDVVCIYALEQAESKGDMDRAKFAIETALGSAGEGDAMVYYYAATYFDMLNEPKKALELMDKAIAALPKSSMKDSEPAKKAMAQIRAEFAKKVK